MIDYYMPIDIQYKDGFKIVVDVADEYLATATSKKWFITRVRVFVDSYVLGISFKGKCSFNQYEEVLENGIVNELILTAMEHAKDQVPRLITKLQACQ